MSGNPQQQDSLGRIRWGIIGCGDIVQKRVAAAIVANPKSVLQGACRRDSLQLREFGRQFGVSRLYANWQEMVADDELDAIYVATPVALHAEPTIAALQRGKHVLVEKPMALTVSECDRMLAAAHDSGTILGVAYYRRFYPHVLRISRAIQDRELGTLMSISMQTGSRFPEHEPDATAWRLDRAVSGGGALMDIGSHRLDLLAMLLGPPSCVQALCGNPVGHGSVETSAHVLLGYAGGVQASLQCYFGAQHVPDEITVTGSLGRVVASPLNEGRLIWQLGPRAWEEQWPVPRNLHGPLIDDFVEAILADGQPRVTGEDGRLVNAIMARAYDAAGWGR